MKEARITPLVATIQTLTIDSKQMTLSVFKQLPEAPRFVARDVMVKGLLKLVYRSTHEVFDAHKENIFIGLGGCAKMAVWGFVQHRLRSRYPFPDEYVERWLVASSLGELYRIALHDYDDDSLISDIEDRGGRVHQLFIAV